MRWVDAATVTAQVVDLQTFRDGANVVLICHTVGKSHLTVKPEVPISVTVFSVHPEPAAAGSGVDVFAGESFEVCRGHGRGFLFQGVEGNDAGWCGLAPGSVLDHGFHPLLL